jgi:hypothetical protein
MKMHSIILAINERRYFNLTWSHDNNLIHDVSFTLYPYIVVRGDRTFMSKLSQGQRQ